MRPTWLRLSLLAALSLPPIACDSNPGGPDASAVVREAKQAEAKGKPGKPANARQRSAID